MGTDLVALDLTLSEVDILVGYQVFMLKCPNCFFIQYHLNPLNSALNVLC